LAQALISHVDRNADRRLAAEVAARGAYLVIDGSSRVKYHPMSTVVELVADLWKSGHGDQLLVGLDHALRSQQTSWGGGPGLTFLTEQFLPRVARELGNQVAHAISVENPAAAFVFRRSA
jgi:phosphotriesterase-related protein